MSDTPETVSPWSAEHYATCRAQLRTELKNFPINKPKDDVTRDLPHGWMQETLLTFDAMYYGRWNYLLEICDTGQLPERPIPPIDWANCSEPHTRKMLETALDAIPRSGSWRGWSGSENFRFFLQWMLYALGFPKQPELPKEPEGCKGASDRLYQIVNIGMWMLYPYDYLGDILAESGYGRGNGFYPTPMPLTEFMVRATFGDCGALPDATEQTDHRLQTVCDPCTGTGRFLLSASNYSLCLTGIDIDPLMVQATLVNAFLYVPWLVCNVPLLQPTSGGNVQCRNALLDPLTARALPNETAEPATQFQTVKVRGHKAEQGLLF